MDFKSIFLHNKRLYRLQGASREQYLHYLHHPIMRDQTTPTPFLPLPTIEGPRNSRLAPSLQTLTTTKRLSPLLRVSLHKNRLWEQYQISPATPRSEKPLRLPCQISVCLSILENSKGIESPTRASQGIP